jgi:hypothetical protein
MFWGYDERVLLLIEYEEFCVQRIVNVVLLFYLNGDVVQFQDGVVGYHDDLVVVFVVEVHVFAHIFQIIVTEH